jgi:pyrroline-5-carboxylate reductase
MNIGFIGVGKITSAIVEGLCTSSMEKAQIYLSPRNEANANRLAGKYTQVQRLESNQQVIDQSDIVFVAVRPAVAVEVLRALMFQEKHIVVSLVPLLKEAELRNAVAPAIQVTRAVPTPAVMQHTGPILLFHSNDTATKLFRYIGQPLEVTNEQQLHVLWTLTGLITPFYDLLHELSSWTITNGVDAITANQYIASLFHALTGAANQGDAINFKELAQHAETPNGMNEQAGREIRGKGSHEAYGIAADGLLRRFE